MVLTLTGASLLWLGWFGFKAGSGGAAGDSGRHAMLVPIGTAAAAFVWRCAERSRVIGICTGAVAFAKAIERRIKGFRNGGAAADGL